MKSKHLRTLLVTTLLSGAVSLAPNTVLARGGGGSYGGGSHGSSYSSGSRGGSVYVSGYTRGNGTYVHSYTRSASGSGLRHSIGSEYSPGSEYSNNSGESSNSSSSNGLSTTPSTFQDALDSAMSAATVTQSAVSKDDWELVSSKWQNAIFLLKQLPNSSPEYAKAQLKIQEYGANLNYARQQLNLPPVTQLNKESLTEPTSSPANPQDTAGISSVSPSPKITPTSSTEVAPEEESNPMGVMILIMLIVISATGFYKAKAIKQLVSKIVSTTKTIPTTKSFPTTKTIPAYQRSNYHIPKNYYVENKVNPLKLTGSIVLTLGGIVALGLLNQKMGGGAVQVSGYRRSNGTFVRSYSRHRPR